MSGFARCVHGCISLPLMYLCFMKPLPWCFRERVPQGWVPRAGRAHTLSLTGSPQVPLGTLADSLSCEAPGFASWEGHSSLVTC